MNDTVKLRGTVYVVVNGRWGSDYSGTLLLDTGECPWGHVSSSLGFLQNDLTTGVPKRRDELAERYPNGYDVVVIDKDDEIPADVLKRNDEWFASLPTRSGEDVVGDAS